MELRLVLERLCVKNGTWQQLQRAELINRETNTTAASSMKQKVCKSRKCIIVFADVLKIGH